MELDETEIYLLENIEKYKALTECERDISTKIYEKTEKIANLLIDKLATNEEWVVSEVHSEDGYFVLLPKKWQNINNEDPFVLHVSEFGLWGLCQIAGEAVTVECIKHRNYTSLYIDKVHDKLNAIDGYECTAAKSHTDTFYSQNALTFQKILINKELNLDYISEFLAAVVQPTINVIDHIINEIKIT